MSARRDVPGVYIKAQTFGDFCSGDRSRRSIILVFDHPVDLDSVRTADEANPSGG